jgi:hypothetical protein
MNTYDVQLKKEPVHSMYNPICGYVVAQQCYVNAGLHTVQQTLSFVAALWDSSATLMQDCTLYSRCHLWLRGGGTAVLR